MFTVVKYTFTICDPDWTMTNSVEWEDIKDLLILGQHKNVKYRIIYKKLKDDAYGDN